MEKVPIKNLATAMGPELICLDVAGFAFSGGNAAVVEAELDMIVGATRIQVLYYKMRD